MRGVLKTSRVLGEIADAFGRVSCFLFLPLMVVIVYDITQRKLLNWYPEFQASSLYSFLPSTKLQEAEWHIHAVLFLFCLGFTYVRNGHVRVELVRDRLRPRTRAWIELIGCLLFLLPYCALVIHFGYAQFERSLAMNESSSATTGLPWRWMVRGSIVIGFIVLAIGGLAVALKHFVYLFGPPELKRQTGDFVEVREIDLLKKEIEQELAQHDSDRAI